MLTQIQAHCPCFLSGVISFQTNVPVTAQTVLRLGSRDSCCWTGSYWARPVMSSDWSLSRRGHPGARCLAVLGVLPLDCHGPGLALALYLALDWFGLLNGRTGQGCPCGTVGYHPCLPGSPASTSDPGIVESSELLRPALSRSQEAAHWTPATLKRYLHGDKQASDVRLGSENILTDLITEKPFCLIIQISYRIIHLLFNTIQINGSNTNMNGT